MSEWEKLELLDFLALHPNMRLKKLNSQQIILEGKYEINAQMNGFEPILNTYQLEIVFPAGYPKSLPTVKESDERIPRTRDYHIFENGSFCLGSDIRLKSILFEYPSATNFVDKILNPFLYAVTYKIKHGIYPFGDLDHGEAGLISDYQRFFNVKGKAEVLLVLKALGKREREADKLPCPCGCGHHIRKCNFRFELERWRQLGSRRWFQKHLSNFTPIKSKKK